MEGIREILLTKKFRFFVLVFWFLFLFGYFGRSKFLGGHLLANLYAYSLIILVVVSLVYATLLGRVFLKPSWSDWVLVLYALYVLYGCIVSINPVHSVEYGLKNFFVQTIVYLLLRSLSVYYRVSYLLLPILIVSFIFTVSPVFMHQHVGAFYGIFSNKNVYGHFALVSSVLFFGLLFVYENILVKMLLAVGFVISCAMLLLSGCRAAVVAFFFGFSLFSVHGLWKDNKIKLAVLWSSMIVVVTLLLNYNEALGSRFISGLLLKDGSLFSRVTIAKLCVDAVAKRPWGWGLGKAFGKCVIDVRCFNDYISGLNVKYPLLRNLYKGGCHSTPLDMGVQGGVLGLFIGFVLFLSVLIIFVKSFNVLFGKKSFCFVVIVAFVCLLINAIFEVMLFSKRGLLIDIFLALAGSCREG